MRRTLLVTCSCGGWVAAMAIDRDPAETRRRFVDMADLVAEGYDIKTVPSADMLAAKACEHHGDCLQGSTQSSLDFNTEGT